MNKIKLDMNWTIFLLFFGVAALDALQTQNWIRVGFWLAIGFAFFSLKQVWTIPPSSMNSIFAEPYETVTLRRSLSSASRLAPSRRHACSIVTARAKVFLNTGFFKGLKPWSTKT